MRPCCIFYGVVKVDFVMWYGYLTVFLTASLMAGIFPFMKVMGHPIYHIRHSKAQVMETV